MEKSKKKCLIAWGLLLTLVIVYIVLVNFANINVLSIISKIFTASGYTSEVPSVTITSDGWSSKAGGSWSVKKSAEWTGFAKATITFDVETNRLIPSANINQDIILVLDTSNSMDADNIGEKSKLGSLKKDAKELIEYLFANATKGNKVALIEFNDDAKTLSGFTSDEQKLDELIDNLEAEGSTNYYKPLVEVDKLLENYTPENGKEVFVIFLTDGQPMKDTPNEIAEYDILKKKYPFLTIHGVQYEMGAGIVDAIRNISDEQHISYIDDLKDILYDISFDPYYYEEFEITDYINNTYFTVKSKDDIKVSIGSVELTTDTDGTQKIIWKVPKNTLRSGHRMRMTINVDLKSEWVDVKDYYPTNLKEEVKSKISELADIEKSTTSTPVLRNGWTVTYEPNLPDGCTTNFTNSSTHFAFETVDIIDDVPTCDGYEFTGWNIVTSKVTTSGSNSFIMPTKDVTIRGTWATLGITKRVQGEVYRKLNLYEVVQNDALVGIWAKDHTGAAAEVGDYKIYYYNNFYDAESPNNLVFAGYCWKMMRTTKSGGVKLLYNGVPTTENGKYVCNNSGETAQVTATQFNTENDSPAYFSYMYGEVYHSQVKTLEVSDYTNYYGNSFTYTNGTYTLAADNNNEYPVKTYADLDGNLGFHHYTCFSNGKSCETIYYAFFANTNSGTTLYYISLTDGKSIEEAMNEMIENKNDSNIKKIVDEWYEANMTSYTKYLEDAIWCNNRTYAVWGGWDPNSGNLNKIEFDYTTLNCPNKRDAFTVNETEIGNGALTYPVGLLINSELIFGNRGATGDNGQTFWTMNPMIFDYRAQIFVKKNVGANVTSNYGVRPAISLKYDMGYSTGDGSINDPYVVELK